MVIHLIIKLSWLYNIRITPFHYSPSRLSCPNLSGSSPSADILFYPLAYSSTSVPFGVMQLFTLSFFPSPFDH